MSDDLRVISGRRRSVSSSCSVQNGHKMTEIRPEFYLPEQGDCGAIQLKFGQVQSADQIAKKYVVCDEPKFQETKEEPVAPQGTFLTSVVTLCMTTLGFGLLSLPKAFASSGVVMCTILIIMFGIITDIGLCIVIKVARATKQESMESLAEYFFGRMCGKLVRYSLIFCLFIAIVSAFTIFMETWGRSGDASGLTNGLLRKYAQCGPTQCSGITKGTVGIMGLILIFPVLLHDSLHGLRHICTLAGVCLLVSLGMFVYVYGDMVSSGESEPIHESVIFLGDIWGLCSVFGIAFMSYLCHFNVIPLYLELQNKDQIYRVIHTTVAIVTPVNVFIGLCGYFLFGEDVKGNAFDSMDSEFGHAAAFIVALVSLLKLPLMFKPFKDAVFAELGLRSDRKWIRGVLTAVFALFGFLIAMFVNLVDVNAIGGALTGAAISFLFPGLYMFAYARSSRSYQPQSDSDKSSSSLPVAIDGTASASLSPTDGDQVVRPSLDSTKVPVSHRVEWRRLPLRRKSGVVLGIAFCAMAFFSGSVGLASAIHSLVEH